MVTLGVENLLIEPGMEQIPNSTWGLVSMTVTLDLGSCNKSSSSLLRINQPNSNLSKLYSPAHLFYDYSDQLLIPSHHSFLVRQHRKIRIRIHPNHPLW